MNGRCKLCRRSASQNSEYCVFHQRAFDNLKEAFEKWMRADDISWNDYLTETYENPETGEWVKEIAASLMRGSTRSAS